MGFRNGTKMGAPNRKGHSWINKPNNSHKECTKCKCTVDIVTVNHKSTCIYRDKYGVKLEECPNCI